MVTLDLADELELADAGTEPTSLQVRAAPPASAPDAHLGDDDLIRRALSLVGRAAHVTLLKRIPIGAGLGGGSADAAAVLRWAGERDPQAALRLGADVPFCVVGGRAVVRGVGELVEPIEVVARTATLALPSLRVDTGSCYLAYDGLALRSQRHPRNDLSAAAEVVCPALVDVRRVLEERTGADFVLAGSGSTLFCEGDPLSLGPFGTQVLETRWGPVRLLTVRTTGPS